MKTILSLVLVSLPLLAMTKDKRGEYYTAVDKYFLTDVYTCTGFIDSSYLHHTESTNILTHRCRLLFPILNEYHGWGANQTFRDHFKSLFSKNGIWYRYEHQKD